MRRAIAMPTTDDHEPRKAAEQNPEQKQLSEEKPADEKDAVKEPLEDTVEHQAGKIIGNG